MKELDENIFVSKNPLTDLLDQSLDAALDAQKRGVKENHNVLVYGITGSGKTAIVNQWLESRGLPSYWIDAGNMYYFTPDSIKKPNTILFLDNPNLQHDMAVRKTLCQVASDKCITDENGITHELPNLLFTITCVMPKWCIETLGTEFTDEEKKCYAHQITFDSNAATTLDFIKKASLRHILRCALSPNDEGEKEIDEEIKSLGLALHILNHPQFAYDTKSDSKSTILCHRIFVTMLLFNHGDPQKFIEKLKYLNCSDIAKTMLRDIVSSYVEADGIKKAKQTVIQTLSELVDAGKIGNDVVDKVCAILN